MRSSWITRFPRGADAARFVLLAAACAAVSVVAIGGSMTHVGRIFPGFVVWDNLVVVAAGPRNWTGVAAGVPMRSVVSRIDGVPVSSRRGLLDAVASDVPGDVHDYTFRTAGGEVARRVAAMRLDVEAWVATFGVYAVNGLLFIAIGLAVFWLRPDAEAGRAVSAFGIVWGLMLLLCLDLFTTGRLDAVYFVVQGLCPAVFLHLALTFPDPHGPAALRRRAVTGAYAIGLAAGLVEVWAYRRDVAFQLRLDQSVWLAVAATGIVALGASVYAVVRGATPLARRRARVVLAGALAAFLLPLGAMLAFFLLGRPVSTNLLIATMFLFPLAVGYAVVRHDLFEADRVVKLSLVYGVMTAIVSLTYGLTVLVTERFVAGVVVTQSPLFPIVFVLAALLTIVPLRDRVQRAVDRLFYRGRIDYKETVARASARLTTLLDRDAIVAHVVATVRDVLFLERAGLWERTADALVARGGIAPGVAGRTLERDHPGLVRFERLGRSLSRDEVMESARWRGDRDDLLALFDALDAHLLVPLQRGGTTAGVLAAGGTASGRPLAADDVDLLETLADQAALALANATAVEEVEAARGQLARQERLATMGELSAAVAHGIRNPLASIRLAAQLGLESATPDDPVRENLTDVLAEVAKLETRVRGVLDFTRPFEPTLEAVALGPLVQGIVDTLAGLAVERRVSVRSSIGAELPLVRADEAHLGQVVLELLTNALDATPEGGAVSVEAAADGARVRLEIADTGPGIAPDLRERVFQLFMTTKPTGTGVGLAVVRQILTRHGASIHVVDNVPRGARFVIDLARA